MEIPEVSPRRRRVLGAGWWMHGPRYFLVFIRELTALFIAAYLVFLLILIKQVAEGAEAYQPYIEFLASPGMLAFHVVAFLFAMFHSISFFNLIPQGMAIRIGEERVHPALMSGPNYVIWAVATAVVLLVILL